jgi:transcriptional regulator with XRE-family HTH domain
MTKTGGYQMRTEFRYGNKVRQLREQRAWTQEQLAEAAGVQPRTIQRLERDQTKSPETLQAVAGAFDVGLDALRTTWRIAESRLVRTLFVTACSDFIMAEQTHTWHAFGRSIMAPLKDNYHEHVEHLVEQVFADRELIEPEETDLWRCHVNSIKKPLQELFDLGLAFYLMDECRDLFLKPIGELKPLSDYIENWQIRHFLLVPNYGCFQLTQADQMHRFNASCRAASEALFRTAKEENTGAHVFTNALYAIMQPGGERNVRWCDTCFPLLPGGGRISFEYIQQITGWDRAELDALIEAVTGEPFIQGLA